MRVAEIRELQGKDTFVVKNIGLYPVVGVESGDVPAVGLAGAVVEPRGQGVVAEPLLEGRGRPLFV